MVVSLKPGEPIDVTVNAHISAGCATSKPVDKVYRRGCSKGGCKAKEVVYASCKTCRREYCLKHRFESDHACDGSLPPPRAPLCFISINACSLFILTAPAQPAKAKAIASSAKPAPAPAPARAAPATAPATAPPPPQQPTLTLEDLAGMTEEQQLALAVQLSINEQRRCVSDVVLVSRSCTTHDAVRLQG